MLRMLEGHYKLVRNPTGRINEAVSRLGRAAPGIDERALLNSDPVPPRLHGLPKLHKEYRCGLL